jgi:hypothetical protein
VCEIHGTQIAVLIYVRSTDVLRVDQPIFIAPQQMEDGTAHVAEAAMMIECGGTDLTCMLKSGR